MNYLSEAISSLYAHPWERSQFWRFFPTPPRRLYSYIEMSGFSPSQYRSSWRDLTQGLSSDDWSIIHFVQYAEDEVRFLRRFPLRLNFASLNELGALPMFSVANKASVVRALIQAQMDYDQSCVESDEFWYDALSILIKVAIPIIFIGDSHTRVFRQTVRYGRQAVTPLNIMCGGGSAIGLSNAASRSGYGNHIAKACKALTSAGGRLSIHLPICLKFGQVDVEFVNTYRRVKEGRTEYSRAEFDSFAEDVARSYVEWAVGFKSDDLYILGINPPCLNDSFIHEAYQIQMAVYEAASVYDADSQNSMDQMIKQVRDLEFPSKQARTAEYMYFNDMLKQFSIAHGLRYMSNFEFFLGPDRCIQKKMACASDGKKIRRGGDGKDIHVGGVYALREEAKFIKSIVQSLGY